MAENGRVNGHDDVSMSDDTPAATPGISTDFSKTNLDGATSQVRAYPDEHDDEEEPPAKRARMHSEAEAMSQHVCVCFFMHGVLTVSSRPSRPRQRRQQCPARPVPDHPPPQSRPAQARRPPLLPTQTLSCPFPNGVFVIRLCAGSRNTRMLARSCALSTLSPLISPTTPQSSNIQWTFQPLNANCRPAIPRDPTPTPITHAITTRKSLSTTSASSSRTL